MFYGEKDKPKKIVKAINTIVQVLPSASEISDGYHTFDELYEFRKLYNAVLFNEWASKIVLKREKVDYKGEYGVNFKLTHREECKYDVHKSWKHHNGELCFGGGWFIVVAVLPTGQISNHYKAEDWDLFKIPETECAKYPFDGHTGQDVLERLKELCK